MDEKGFMDKSELKDRFTAARAKRCEELMLPEIRALLDLPLEEKVKKSQAVIREALAKDQTVGLGYSGGTDSLVLLYLTLPIKHDIPVVFVDTQH
jgi:3'-phosphoadenosine 5'-phosphosulfate sulfotransferase (PAPS reductase)/FAD synthetase